MGDYTIVASKVRRIMEEQESLTKRASKFGIEGIPTIVSVSPSYIMKVYDHDGQPHYIRVVDIVVDGEFRVTDKYNIVGHIIHGTSYIEDEAGKRTFFNTVSYIQDGMDSKWETAPPHCEHCGKRRSRKTTFVLRNKQDGNEIQVGSSCMGDFTGRNLDSLSFYHSVWAFLEQLGREHGEAISGNHTDQSEFSVIGAIACTLDEVARTGYYVSSSSIEEKPTSHAVREMLCLDRKITQDEMEAAADVRSHVLGILENRIVKSEYEINLCNLLKSDYAQVSKIGLAASTVAFWQSNKPLVTKDGETVIVQVGHIAASGWNSYTYEATVNGQPVKFISPKGYLYGGITLNVLGKMYTPEVKNGKAVRFTRTVTVTGLLFFETIYGGMFRVIMEDNEGHTFVWLTSTVPNAEEGLSYILVASFKGHTLYEGSDTICGWQNEVSRCKLTPAE